MFLSEREAFEIFEEVISLRNKSDSPFTKSMEKTFREHSRSVADNAALIASYVPSLDKQEAYACGLLHDAGRLNDEYVFDGKHHFHALEGYYFLKKKCPRYPQLAQTALLHELLAKDKTFFKGRIYRKRY